MLKTLAVLATITYQTFAADDGLSVRILTQKALDDRIGKTMLFHLDHQTELSRVCAIPLLEARTPAINHLDPMSRPATPQTFDKMGRPPQVKVCPRP